MSSAYETLLARLQEAFDTLSPGADPVLRASDHGDYQANGVMALAKALGRPPRDVAGDVVAAFAGNGLAQVEVAGPGFLNVTLAPAFLSAQLVNLTGDDRLGVPVADGSPPGGD